MKLIGFDDTTGTILIVGGSVFPAGTLRAEPDQNGIIHVKSIAQRVELAVHWREIAKLDGAPFAYMADALSYLSEVFTHQPNADDLESSQWWAANPLPSPCVVKAVSASHVDKASATVLADRDLVTGLTTQSVDKDHPVTLCRDGCLTSVGWGLTPDLPLFLGHDGVATQTTPTAPLRFLLKLGRAIDPDTALIRISMPISLV